MNSVDWDIFLYGNSYITKNGHRLDPTRIRIEGEVNPETKKFNATRYLYETTGGKTLVFPADEVEVMAR